MRVVRNINPHNFVFDNGYEISLVTVVDFVKTLVRAGKLPAHNYDSAFVDALVGCEAVEKNGGLDPVLIRGRKFHDFVLTVKSYAEDVGVW